MPIELLIPILAVVALLLFAVFGADALERARKRRYEQAAADLHFKFHDKDQSVLPATASRFHLMRLGQIRVAERIMRGEANGIGVTLFEISNTSGVAIFTKVRTQTVVAFDSPALTLPWFFLRPSAVFGQLPPPPGLENIDLSEHPQIAAAHALAAEPGQEEAALHLFDPEMLAYLKKSPGVCLEGWGDLLLVYYPERAVELAEYPGFLEEAFRLFALLKR